MAQEYHLLATSLTLCIASSRWSCLLLNPKIALWLFLREAIPFYPYDDLPTPQTGSFLSPVTLNRSPPSITTIDSLGSRPKPYSWCTRTLDCWHLLSFQFPSFAYAHQLDWASSGCWSVSKRFALPWPLLTHCLSGPE